MCEEKKEEAICTCTPACCKEREKEAFSDGEASGFGTGALVVIGILIAIVLLGAIATGIYDAGVRDGQTMGYYPRSLPYTTIYRITK
jgi:hypothetical protein